MSIKNWPTQERPREKLLKLSAANLSDAELLAIFLRTGIKGRNVLTLARDLLKQFNSLRGLLNATKDEMVAIPGIGLAKYVQFQAALEIGRRYLQESILRDTVLTHPDATKAFLKSKLRDRKQEVFAALFLDQQLQVITYEELFFGTVNGAVVYPREIVKKCLAHNASHLIIAHNHPSGIADPSEADIELTHSLKQVLTLIEVKILDHLIIGEGKIASFAEMGILG